MMVTLQYGVLWNSYIKTANLDDSDDRQNTGCFEQANPAKPANLDDGDDTITGVMEQLHQTS